jgi:16S rRNA (guanine527-N7)-methyltransferase
MTKNKVDIFIQELIKWNRKISLISKRDINFIYERHLYDSLKILNHIPKNRRLLDIGSGNGFPSIPIAIHRNDVHVYAMEPQKKKVFFIRHVKKKAGLGNLYIIQKRIEEQPKRYDSFFNIITARAIKITGNIFEKTLFYGKKRFTFLLFNSFENNDIGGLSTKYHKVIHSVEKYVYKLADRKIRYILKIDIVKG